MTRRNAFAAIGLLLSVLFSGCLKDKLSKTYTYYTPVFAPRGNVLEKLTGGEPRSINAPGKFYLYGQYLFLNETGKGIHIINNSNPSQPVNIGFLDIPGNLDVAVKGSILYADFYADLAVIDISNPEAPVLKKVVENVFPERAYQFGISTSSGQVIVDWERHDTTVDISTYHNYASSCSNCVFMDNFQTAAAASAGVGGSMARMTIVGDYLYTVDRHTLTPVNISDAANPVAGSQIGAGWDIETIYPFQDKLFLGSMGGLFIYNLNDPAQPVKESEFQHARACDPVVADGRYAFVTLRQGTTCGPAKNEMLVLDVSQIAQPVLLKSYDMTRPSGLSFDGNLLFVCDGDAGLRIFDAADVMQLQDIGRIPLADPYDVIAYQQRLYVVAADGLYQYRYNSNGATEFLSKITKTGN